MGSIVNSTGKIDINSAKHWNGLPPSLKGNSGFFFLHKIRCVLTNIALVACGRLFLYRRTSCKHVG